MRSFLAAALIVLVVASLSSAQQPSQDQQIVFLGKALAALQAQRNSAMDDIVNARAQLALVSDQLASVTAERDALKAQVDAGKKEKDR